MKATNFWEVTDHKGNAVWGGNSAMVAIEWYRKGLGNKVYASVWDESDQENPTLITDKVDVTNLILATILDERERGRS